jgi:hypothetical protein
VVVGLAADRHAVVAGQHDHAARVHGAADHLELLGEVGAGQLHVAVDDEVAGDEHVAVEQARDAPTGVDGADRGRAVVGLGVDADRMGAVRRDAGAAGALAEHAREALRAGAVAVHAVVERLAQDPRASPAWTARSAAGPLSLLASHPDGARAVRRDTGVAGALTVDATPARPGLRARDCGDGRLA